MNGKLFTLFFSALVCLFLMAGCTQSAAPGGDQPVSTAVAAEPSTPSCVVPDIVGLDQAIAESSLTALGLQPVRSVQPSDATAPGAIISQDPAGGTRLDPCQGDVLIMISLPPPPGPTNTPAPTYTPAPPTITPTPSPIPPTRTPVPSATPTPDPRLFWDDFETGIRSEWGMSGDNFISANGKLTSVGLTQGYIGDNAWANYQVTLARAQYSSGMILTILLRVQDRDNHMKMTCRNRTGGWYGCSWYRVVNGQEHIIPGTPHDSCYGWCTFQVEADRDGVYRMLVNGEVKFRFVDTTFSSGGVGLILDGHQTYELDYFEVIKLP